MMNKLRNTPNILKRLTLPAVLTLALGTAACTKIEKSPDPSPSASASPSPTVSPAPQPTSAYPSCSVYAYIKGKHVVAGVTSQNKSEPGQFVVDKVSYSFGDGTPVVEGAGTAEVTHDYKRPGTYELAGFMTMQTVGPPGAPFKDGAQINCGSTSISITNNR